MGLLGPLTAQALGRSPYDPYEPSPAQEEAQKNAGDYEQQYDSRGRPINLETRRINRNIVKAHNEIMACIGVAEPDHQDSAPEAELHRSHFVYEEKIGRRLASAAIHCVENVGVFGINGLRQRILIYKRYSEIPFWELFRKARDNGSLSRDLFRGAPLSLATSYIEHRMSLLWINADEKAVSRRWIHEGWSYIRVHLELFVALQRLGLVPASPWLPPLSYFCPFTEASPIPMPPSLDCYDMESILKWLGGLMISVTPFLCWVLVRRTARDWRPRIWQGIIKSLPSTFGRGRRIPQPPPSPTPPPGPPGAEVPSREATEASSEAIDLDGSIESREVGRPELAGRVAEADNVERAEAVGQASVLSAGGDEYPSEDEGHEALSATLISFDVEATEAADAPSGLWSAELRPSLATESEGGHRQTYCDTLLTQLPAMIASHVFTNAVLRIITAPHQVIALRLAARVFRLRHGLGCADIWSASLLQGINLTSLENFLAVELLHLTLSGEIWAAFTGLAQFFHFSHEEWAEAKEVS